MPYFLSAVHRIHKVPHRAEIIVGLIIATVIVIADLRTVIGFSSFAVLMYYAVSNIACLTLKNEQRLWPKWMSAMGLMACLVVAFNLPIISVSGGIVLFIIGLFVYSVSHKYSKKKPEVTSARN